MAPEVADEEEEIVTADPTPVTASPSANAPQDDDDALKYFQRLAEE